LAAHLPKIGQKVRRITGSLQIDSRAIRDRLGWTPPQSLEAGLVETALWYSAARPDGLWLRQ
jgi:UDP-glucose 4-epimerase